MIIMNEVKNLGTLNEEHMIHIPHIGDYKYNAVIAHKPTSSKEKDYVENLKRVSRMRINGFDVPVCDPSLNKNGDIQFKPGFQPAINHSYIEWEKLAEKVGGRIGTRDEYYMFTAILISRLMDVGCSEANAWYSVVTDSKYLGFFSGTINSKLVMEKTGSRYYIGKCDMGNTAKILSKDKYGCIPIASGAYNESSYRCSIASMRATYNCLMPLENAVGWIIF